jgi:hypothetical protein
MKKLMFVLMLVVAVVVSQTAFTQDKPVEKKVDTVVKIKKDVNKDTGKMGCCKDKKCCDKCAGDKCDGKCCAKCAKCKKEGTAKCDMGKKEKCPMDSTSKCDKQDMKKQMEKKKMIKKEVKIEEDK